MKRTRGRHVVVSEDTQTTVSKMLQRFKWGFIVLIACIVVMVMFFWTQQNIPIKPLSSYIGTTTDLKTDKNNSHVQADRWIVVDGTKVLEEHLVNLEDVPGWRILIFGKDSNIFRENKCSNCVTLNTVSPTIANLHFPTLTKLKIMSYHFALSHGAKWIFVASHLVNLKDQVGEFNTKETLNGLLYKGPSNFDPDRHFGVKDVSGNRTVRNNQLSYKLGEYGTPSVQTRWQLPEHVTGTTKFNIKEIACRLPHVIVPSELFPPTDLNGSLIEYRSFWVLGSLLSESSTLSLTYWWLLLMRDVKETVGQYPPLCKSDGPFVDDGGTDVPQAVPNTLSGWKCQQNKSFLTCGLALAKEMNTHSVITQSNVLLIKHWFDLLVLLNYREPKRHLSPTISSRDEVHNVVFEAMSKPSVKHGENPFKNVCELQKTNVPETLPKVKDILLIIIFNFSLMYSNILYLDNIYRKYFTNILYCGSNMDRFSKFHQTYNRPVSFLELNVTENAHGRFGYLCSAYAMEMGFRVSGYLQMSDDVLLNMWNIDSLPRDKSWFQSSIKKGLLSAVKVPNITPLNGKTWPVWDQKDTGVKSLRNMWSRLGNLTEPHDKSRVDSFFNQLSSSFGRKGAVGVFYEASDIFYVPDKFKENFSFFSKHYLHEHVHLELAVPTMLCGFDDINNVVRLPGTYLWFKLRKDFSQHYNPKHIFLHPWKLKKLFTEKEGREFFCTKYFLYLDGI